jgi:hypothetical protein
LFKGPIVTGPDCAGLDCAGPDSVGPDCAGPDCAGPDRTCTADSPAVNVIAYMCIIAKLGNVEGLRIGMDPLRGVFWTLEGPV